MIRAYDDNGNVVDLVKWEKQIRADAIENFIEKIGFCCSSDTCYTKKECSECVYNTISEKEVLRVAEQLKEQN